MSLLLEVDLSTGSFRQQEIAPELARSFLGGSGLAAALIAQADVAEIDPLGSGNPLIFMTGPLTGTAMPSASRYSVCALSPLTGIWGESNSGGFFGPELRFAGFDGITLLGRSPHPVWLSVRDGIAELHDATSLVGLDTYETQAAIRQAMGDEKARIACIGPAGESGVRYAAVINDHGRAAGRAGMGAVMGSKGLKAIAARGTGAIPLHDQQALEHIASRVLDASADDIAAQAIGMAGTAGYFDMGMMYGDAPIRFFREGEWAGAESLSGVRMTEEFLVRRRACFHCPIACGRETRAKRFGVERVDGPEYETVGALGALLAIDDLEAVIYAGHRCNALGMDTISFGGTLALACELFEQKILPADEIEGVELGYGDTEMLLQLIEDTASRRGFGSRLAEGSRALAARYGVPELAPVVNGLELPMHDPRAFHGMAVTYALSPRGACHMQGDLYSVDTGQLAVEPLGIEPGDRFENTEARGALAARTMLWRTLYNAINLCQFQNPGFDLVLESLNAATGWGFLPTDFISAGRKIIDLKRLVNRSRGLTAMSDGLPSRLLMPLGQGGAVGRTPDLPTLLAGAYQEFGWDPDTGMPDGKRIREHGYLHLL